MIGTTVSHYRVIEKVGAGGMGEVYMAEDVRLRRRVALKILPEDLTRDPERRLRFIQEARAAAAIDHPHIAAIYDVDEIEGRWFIAMEYVRGQSLRDAIRLRRLSLPQALELAIQVADGLAKVHERGVVHRDLKPENIVVSEDGYAKIIDFGLAKLIEPLWAPAADQSRSGETQTRIKTSAGTILGTVAYMSPEQARGTEVDARSDIFSFGVVLYEMLSGEDPFKRPSAIETLSAILKDTPPPLHLPEAERHPEVQHILTRALAKETDQRYQNMKELVADLRQLRDELASGKRARQPLWPKVAGAAALAVALVFGGWWYARRHTAAPAARQPVSVLVADFQNKTDLPVFDGALEQAIAIGLEGAPFISSYSRPQARKQATELDAGAAGRLDQRLAQLVGRSQGIKVAVAGSIEPKGEGFLLKAWAVDVVTSQNVAEASKTVSSKADVLKAADGLATELRSDLGDTTIEGQALEGETFTTTSLDAMNSYARAQELQGLGKYEEAMTELRKAIAQDPDMGRAYAGLGAMLGNMGERDEAEKYYQMALSRLDRMTEREKRRTRGGYFLTVGHDAQKAIDEYGALVAQYPADTAGHTNLALAYFYAGDMKRALDEGRRAVELFPKSVPHRTNLALYALYAGDFDTVERETKEVLAQNASFEKAHLAMALAEMARNRPKQAAEIYGRLNTVSARGASLAAIGLADLALYEGRPGEAIGSLEKGIAGDVANRNNAAAAIKSAVLAGALLLRGQTAAALAAADEATKGSRNEAVASLAARVYVAAGRDAKALALASELSGRLQPAPQAYAKLINAAVHTARGRVREAIPLLQEARTRTDTWLGRFELGRAYVEAGAFAEADSELETCLKRSGEATAAFLDDVPTARFLPPVHYYLGRAKEGLKSPRAADSFRTFLAIKENAEGDPLVTDLRRRLPVR